MEDIGIVTLGIIGLNGIVSYFGFNNHAFFENNLFQVRAILAGKDYKRMITSGFLHADWGHLLFNMISFYSFSTSLEYYLGPVKFLILYFVSLIGGNMLSLFIHQRHGNYRAVGASGAVCGIIFAAIALFPGIEVGFIFIPIPIPGWIFGIIYALYTIYGIKSNLGNIGHEAHLGGGIIGLVVAVVLVPAVLTTNLFAISMIAIPTLGFIIVLIVKPGLLIK
jgi:membrane associated rhomboid family serine protease